MARYPDIRVTRRTSNSLLLVAIVRHELRRAGVPTDEIHLFSAQALSDNARRAREVCRQWVSLAERST